MTTDIIPAGSPYLPALTITQAAERRNAIVEFTQTIMRQGVDFGAIPGTDKPTLLKPGAEKLCTQFGLSPSFEQVEATRDWTGAHTGGEPLFFYEYRCRLVRDGRVVGEGIGSCNSWEKKYRYRKAERVCPACGAAAIIKGKKEYGGGWLCFGKKGGCGAKYGENEPAITQQEAGQVPNTEVADLVNTISKMAQKRALVAATLIALNASEFFTQDMEDLVIDVPAEASYAPPAETVSSPPRQNNTDTNKRTADAAEAERRFYVRYAPIVGGETWQDVQQYLGSQAPRPNTLEGWVAVAEAVKDKQRRADYDAIGA